MFALTPEQQRKAQLTHGPGRDGTNAFSRAMEAVALYQDFEALPASLRQPASLKQLAARPHDAACLSPVFMQLATAMLGNDEVPGR